MAYQRVLVPQSGPASALSEDEFTFRDTDFRVCGEAAYWSPTSGNATGFTDPASETVYSVIGGGSNTIANPVTVGDFSVRRSHYSNVPSGTRPGLNIGVLAWRGKAGVTVAAIVRWVAAAAANATYYDQRIIGDYNASDGTGLAWLTLGLSAGLPTLAARHTSISESTVSAQLAAVSSDRWYALIGQVDYENGLVSLEDVASGASASATGDAGVWNAVAGNPATSASFLLTRGTTGGSSTGRAFVGDFSDVMFWDHLRTAAQLEHLRYMMRQRLAGLAA